MSTRFTVVKEEPKDLAKDTYIIKAPDFLEEIKSNKGREPRGGQTASTHLRYIVGTIGAKYDPALGAYSVKPHLYEGRKYDSDAELSTVIVEMLQSQYPKIFESYLDHKIKQRPPNTKLIYFVGGYDHLSPFIANGIGVIDERDVEELLNLKSQKKSKL